MKRQASAIAGGVLDPDIEGCAVYLGTPEPAQASPAAKVAERYVQLVQQGRYSELAELFHDDAVFLHPGFRQPRQGRAAIADFYENFIGPMKPDVIAVSYAGEGPDCFVELAVRVTYRGGPRYVLASVDHFRTDGDGKVVFMTVFTLPLPPADA
jgi:ketosteroid isomerase-like protein